VGVIAYAGNSAVVGSPSGRTNILRVVGALLVVAGGTAVPNWGPELALGTAPARWVGQWSYGMYLWQIPVLLLIDHWWRAPQGISLPGRLAFVALAMALAGLSFAYFESPIRQLPWLVKSPWLTLRLALGVTVLACSIVTLLGL
jgi:peptidoglycan/LPS O-acetylase OafA/YrhL